MGVIYILTNPSFPEYVKIGYADDLNRRLKDLNRSECIPFAFRVFATYEVKERLQDVKLHKMIDGINPNLRAIETFDGKERKKEFYAMSADDAYAILETIATISGTPERLKKSTPDAHEILDEEIAKDIEEKAEYVEDRLTDGKPENIKNLYLKYKTEILKFNNVFAVPQKLYVAFKVGVKNVVEIEIHNGFLKIILNLKKGQLKDSLCLTDDISEVGHWGRGDYKVDVVDESNFDYIISLIKQVYDKIGD